MRLKSTAVWYDLPDVEAAYMPIGAPSAVDALMNIGHTDPLGNHRMAGRYTATPGVLPTWSAARGWNFNGTTQYLDTGVVPRKPSSMVMRLENMTGSDRFSGIYEHLHNFYLCPRYGLSYRSYGHGNYNFMSTYAVSSGVMGVAGNNGYLDGAFETIIPDYEWTTTYTIHVGGSNGTYVSRLIGKVPATLIVSRQLTSAEMWLASRQMAYCEQNPDWNAWARRRRYYYAPSAAYAQRLLFAEQMRAMQ